VDVLPSGFPLKKNNEKVIIYQGALNMGRGLELAIRAMLYTENFRLIIAGSGYLAKELHTLVVTLGLEEKVKLIGMIHPDELLQYTVQADLGISLEENKGMNYYYALPNKLFDYIQARIPVLVSDLPEMASIVNTYDVGRVIQTNDPLGLSDAFKLMLNDGDRLDTWKKNLDKASAELCWEKEENKLLEIYSRVIRDHAFSAAGK